MEINVLQLRKNLGETLTVHFDQVMEPVLNENENYIFKGPVKVDVSITNTGNYLLLKGKVSADIELQCVRCLNNFDFSLQNDFEEKYCHQNQLNELSESGIEEDECNIFNGETINLTEDVKDNLLLNLPMKPVCSNDCRGLCPTCGLNLNTKKCNCQREETDIRLEVLKKLLND